MTAHRFSSSVRTPHSRVEAATLTVSVVVPVYGCASALRELHRRTSETLTAMNETYELIFVDDRGGDGSWEILVDLAAGDPHVRALRLAHNVGQQLAITAGLEHCRGAYAVVMDCDLEDPPEMIPEFLAKAREGYEIVLSKRRSALQRPLWRQIGTSMYYRGISWLIGQKIDPENESFSVISRKVIDAFLQFKERDRHYLFLLRWMGFDTATVEYMRHPRHSGKSSYSWSKLLVHAVRGVIFATTRPLYWVVYLGLLVATLGTLMAIYVIARYMVHDILPGWTSLIVVQLLLGGFIIASIGIAAVYIGRIFAAVQDRPLYLVEEDVGEAAETDTDVELPEMRSKA